MTPVQEIIINGTKVIIKRDDLNHPIIQGNKLRKLKYNVVAAKNSNCQTLVTFGGAFSNHIVATAYAAKMAELKSVGFIRGDELANKQERWSKTLNWASEYGMELVFLDRQAYRQKSQSTVFRQALKKINNPYVLPEGGSNKLACQGVAELVDELNSQLTGSPTHIVCACGTGGTLAGIIQGVSKYNDQCKVIGIPVLKGLHSLETEINQWLRDIKPMPEWSLLSKYHFGGYARSNSKLIEFACQFTKTHGIELDKIYNSKSFFALSDLIDKAVIKTTDRPLIIHTGGLQGGSFDA
ncbi:MAG: pyridoxal-phosphate dependent enzyme [Proteobacteria bacterium]|nr:pyridoxal-phosphate dependent enzyme [Pseudomonadota bacterium]